MFPSSGRQEEQSAEIIIQNSNYLTSKQIICTILLIAVDSCCGNLHQIQQGMKWIVLVVLSLLLDPG